jgi:hypothetical protein
VAVVGDCGGCPPLPPPRRPAPTFVCVVCVMWKNVAGGGAGVDMSDQMVSLLEGCTRRGCD